MNVLMVTPWDLPFGGVPSVVHNIAKELTRRGHSVVFLHPGITEQPEPRTTVLGYRGYEMNLRTMAGTAGRVRGVIAFLVKLLPALLRLRGLLLRERIDVINIHYPVESYVHLGLVRLLAPVKLVVSLHGADLFPGGKARPRNLGLGTLLRRADAIVAPSHAFLRDCLDLAPWIGARGVTIHNGVDFSELLNGKPATAAPEDGPLLCIAAHNAKKALDVLLRAFALLLKSDPLRRLLLVGDGPLRSEHEALARSLGLDGRVEFLGERGRDDVVRLLKTASLFVLPSRSEPFGMVVVEAMISRLPVVASNVGGIAEIVENGKSGVLVAPDDPAALSDAMLRVLNDRALGAALADAGFQRATRNFSSEAMGAHYEALLARLVAGQPAAAGNGS